jgi:predicted transcriptional regulator
MALSNELNSEIVAALVAAKKRSSEELQDLKNVLLEVHSTLQSLDEAAARERVRKIMGLKAGDRFNSK